jgi:hypothetical protein
MAFTAPFDPEVPTDADEVSEDEFRAIKAGVIERMNTIVENFEDGTEVEGETVLKLKDTLFPDQRQFSSGTLAQRPNPPEKADLLYRATDTDQLFQSVADGAEFEWEEIHKEEEEVEITQLLINAAEARFAPTGSETRATRVKNAIAEAAAAESQIKVVYIPKTLWGYVADSDFSAANFNSGILLVREGAITGGYDPIAYGADPSGSANSQQAIATAYLHASTATLGTRIVTFTVAGSYLMPLDVDQLDVPQFLGADVVFTGGGEFTGTRPFRIPADPPAETISFLNFNAAGTAGSRASEVEVVHTIYMRVTGEATGTDLSISLTGEPQFDDYPLSKLHTLVASMHHRVGSTDGDNGGDGYGVTIDPGTNSITFTNLASGEVVEFDLVMNFTA